jgi:hypothetical protein
MEIEWKVIEQELKAVKHEKDKQAHQMKTELSNK